ncbi:MAG: hypothetical protein V1770_00270 [bacterium]
MEEEIKKLLEENLMYSKEIHQYAKTTKRILMFDQILSVIKILIIVVPLIWGFLYLAPYMKQVAGMYSELLGGNGNSLDIGKLLK